MNCNIVEYGAVHDGSTKDTQAIQKAIDTCASEGGGVVSFEPGTYLTGTIYLKSGVYLDLAPGCTLKGSPDFEDYNPPDAWPQNTCSQIERTNGAHLIVGLEIQNAGIRGGGRIDGNGRHFGWRKEDDFRRPAQMVYFCESSRITLQDIELCNSPYWSCLLHGCEDVIISGVRIRNNKDIPNGDGLDIDSSSRVCVSNCIIDTQDDCITLRGVNADLKQKNRICEDILISNCFLSTECNAMRIGVGNGGLIRNCVIDNMIIRHSLRGICIEAWFSEQRSDVSIENIRFNNLHIECRDYPIFIAAQSYGIFDLPTGTIHNIAFSNLHCDVRYGCIIEANEGRQVRGISFHNAVFEFTGTPILKEQKGYSEWCHLSPPAPFYIANADDVRLEHITLRHPGPDCIFRTPVIAENSTGVICHEIHARFAEKTAESESEPT